MTTSRSHLYLAVPSGPQQHPMPYRPSRTQTSVAITINAPKHPAQPWLGSQQWQICVSLLCPQLGGRGALDQPSLEAPWVTEAISVRSSEQAGLALRPLHSSHAPSTGAPALGCQRAGLGGCWGPRVLSCFVP